MPSALNATSPDAPDFDPARRFGGLERLFGGVGAARIRGAHVLVAGIGGVGSWAVEALARSGVGRLTLVDLDHISESNVNRQIHAVNATVGQAKVEAMRERIGQINPACSVLALDEFVASDNWATLLDTAVRANGPVTAVIDACDQISAKLAMTVWARTTGASFITVGAAGGKRLAHLVEIEDLLRVTHDPLLAALRQRLRKAHGAPREGRKMGVNCVFSREPVAAPNASCVTQENESDPDGSLNCHGYGSVVSVTATFGQCAAGWILNEIAGEITI